MKNVPTQATATRKRFQHRDTGHQAVYGLPHDYLHSVILLKYDGNFSLIFRTANVLLELSDSQESEHKKQHVMIRTVNHRCAKTSGFAGNQEKIFCPSGF
jgi:hypothetical protein